MLAVVGHPLGHGPLDRHGAQDRERRADRRVRLEAAVGEQRWKPTVIPSRRRVEADEQDHVHRADGDAPQQAHRGEDAERRHHHRDEGDDAARDARARSRVATVARRTVSSVTLRVSGSVEAWSTVGRRGRSPSSVYGPDRIRMSGCPTRTPGSADEGRGRRHRHRRARRRATPCDAPTTSRCSSATAARAATPTRVDRSDGASALDTGFLVHNRATTRC